MVEKMREITWYISLERKPARQLLFVFLILLFLFSPIVLAIIAVKALVSPPSDCSDTPAGEAMTDIVDRLRIQIHLESAAISPQTSALIEVAKEAADEIERLRAEKVEWNSGGVLDQSKVAAPGWSKSEGFS